jgi:hypothetical protein
MPQLDRSTTSPSRKGPRCGQKIVTLIVLAAFASGSGALAQSSSGSSHIPDLGGFYRHNTSAYSPPVNGMPGPVSDYPGYDHNGSDPWVGDYLNPILQEHTAVEVRRLNELELSGGVNLAAFQVCKLLGVPLILTQRENIELLQEPDRVTIIYQRDHHIRHVYLNVPHTDNPAHSWYGESVGHYEGDTLVVDTIAQNGKSRADRYGSFSSPETHVVERYSLIDGGNTLQVSFTVTDPVNFTMPWSATQNYRHSNTPWEEVVCAENNRDAQTGLEYEDTPVDATPDF